MRNFAILTIRETHTVKWKVCQELMCAYAFQTSRQSEEEVPQGAVERLPEDLLRWIFARLPKPVQDALHARLFPPG